MVPPSKKMIVKKCLNSKGLSSFNIDFKEKTHYH